MSGNTIIRAARNSNNPYAQIARSIFEDDRVSWRAKGLMGYLLSRKDDWKVYVGDLQKRSTDGRDACYKALDELGRAGYLERIQHREKGRVQGTEYVIHELPDAIRTASWKTVSGSTVSGKAVSGNTVSGNSATSNKELKAITEEVIPEDKTHTHAADAAESVPEFGELEIPEPQTPPTPQAPVPDQTPSTPQANEGSTTPEALDTVPGGAAKAPSRLLARLMAVYNEHRGQLPAIVLPDAGREKAALALVRQYGTADLAAEALRDATCWVAQEAFWQGKGWGFKTLVPGKVSEKAEAWRSRPKGDGAGLVQATAPPRGRSHTTEDAVQRAAQTASSVLSHLQHRRSKP